MGFLEDIIGNYNTEIVLAIVGLNLLLLMFNFINRIKFSSITKKYDRLVAGVEAASLEDMLIEHLDEVKEVKSELGSIKKYCDDINSRLKFSLQKIGFIRYNAFNDMGSDLSFSIALLDESLNGFVITSIYGRDESNVYAKPLVNGKSSYALSVEEMQAIDRARKQSITL
ncbi:DUF4446 family protein [Brassicibacter mesophilus]|uniref:DUF4446 family protein n=1 Tax=Brassicibacter mesophilus TaxID=745119 RepID=UPI003D24F118